MVIEFLSLTFQFQEFEFLVLFFVTKRILALIVAIYEKCKILFNLHSSYQHFLKTLACSSITIFVRV